MRMLNAFLLAFAGAVVLLTGCTSNRFYTPNTMQIPVLTRQGDSMLSGGLAKGEKHTGLEVQAVYSPLPHVGVLFNHASLSYSGVLLPDPILSFYYETPYKGSNRLTEGGLGGYTRLGPEKEYLLSLFGGFGQGRVENRYSPPPDVPNVETYDTRWRQQRWFVQPALAMQHQHFQVGMGLRFVWLQVYDGQINDRVGLYETDKIHLLETSSPLFLTEMAWSVGWRLRPVVLSLNSTAVVRGKNALRELSLASNYVSLSAGLNLHELKHDKKPGRRSH